MRLAFPLLALRLALNAQRDSYGLLLGFPGGSLAPNVLGYCLTRAGFYKRHVGRLPCGMSHAPDRDRVSPFALLARLLMPNGVDLAAGHRFERAGNHMHVVVPTAGYHFPATVGVLQHDRREMSLLHGFTIEQFGL